MGELFERVRPVRPLEWTGERLTTDTTGQVEVEHLHRYFLARELTRGADVLDVASGEGYGSAFLAQTARSVIGVEIDRTAVEHARASYVAQNLRFEQGSAQSIPLPDQSVDCVVSFETIEHFYDQEKFLTEIRRVLRPGGKLIVSSPNRDMYSPTGAPPNPYHFRELTRDEFEKLLRANFEHVTLLAQRQIVGSVIAQGIGADGPFNSITFERRGEDRYEASIGLDRPVYFVAIASDISLPSIPESFYFERGSVDDVVVALPGLRLEHQRIQESLRSIEETNAKKDAQIDRLSAENAKKDAQIGQLLAVQLMLTNTFGFRLKKLSHRIINWKSYNDAYWIWNQYKKKNVSRDTAIKAIENKYSVSFFFLFYPIYKIVRPFVKIYRKIAGP